jgi:hypothetical protein
VEEYTVEIHPDQYTKKNCLTCRHSDENNKGERCKESNLKRWNSCTDNYLGWEGLNGTR